MTDPVDRQGELVALVKADYDATRSLIDGVVRTSLALRAAALTLTLAILGYGAAHKSSFVGLVGLVVSWFFLYLDAYHGWLYNEGRKRARKIEHIVRARYKQLERGDEDPDAGADLDRLLAAHEFGQYLALQPFKRRKLVEARPRIVYILLYGTLTALAGITIVYGCWKL